MNCGLIGANMNAMATIQPEVAQAFYFWSIWLELLFLAVDI